MKIIHCADVHLCSSLTTNYDKETANKRKNELLKTFSRMFDYAEENNVEAIIIAGDLFDKDDGISKIKTIVFKIISSHSGIKVFYLRGNHDNKQSFEEIPDNLFLFSDNWAKYEIGYDNKIAITGVELSKHNTGIVYNMLNLQPDQINIVVLHGQRSNSDSKNDAETINLKALKNKNIDYLALGHIHYNIHEPLDARGSYCYPGCLEGRGFDELGKHGFMLLDIDEKSMKLTADFVPFAEREIFYQEVDISSETNSYVIAKKLKQAIKDMKCGKEDIVEFVLTGMVELNAEIDLEIINQLVKDDVYYLKVQDKSVVKVDYAQYELDKSLKGEFVRTVHADPSLSDDEKATIIKVGIDALAGKEI